MSVEYLEYHGGYYDFSGLVIDPHALQSKVPLWIGGHGRRALRRAVSLADGWMPGACEPAALHAMLVDFPDRCDHFDVVVGTGQALDAVTQARRVEDRLGELAAAGATMISVRPFAHSFSHYLGQLDAIAALGRRLGCL